METVLCEEVEEVVGADLGIDGMAADWLGVVAAGIAVDFVAVGQTGSAANLVAPVAGQAARSAVEASGRAGHTG